MSSMTYAFPFFNPKQTAKEGKDEFIPTPKIPDIPTLAPLPKPPDLTTATDRARAAREAADAAGRKRGRAASIFTGPEGVSAGATPLGFKTLVGS